MSYEPVTAAELLHHRGERPGVRAFLNTVLFLFAGRPVRSGGIYNRRPVRGGSSWSLHAVGRAVDIMVPAGNPVGFELFLRCVNAGDRLGICEVIYNRRRWTPERGTQPYNGENAHLDHVHIGFTTKMADQPNTPALCHWYAVGLIGA
jgi:hypothetical protein